MRRDEACWTTGMKTRHTRSLSGPRLKYFSLTDYKKKFSLCFDCRPCLSELYPVQQYPIVCLQDEHRNCFWVKPRGDSHRNSHRLQSSISAADNLREHKAGAAYVSDNVVWISERVRREMWRGARGLIFFLSNGWLKSNPIHLQPTDAFNVVKPWNCWKMNFFLAILFTDDDCVFHMNKLPVETLAERPSGCCCCIDSNDFNNQIIVTLHSCLIHHELPRSLFAVHAKSLIYCFIRCNQHTNKNICCHCPLVFNLPVVPYSDHFSSICYARKEHFL